ncbi:MAG TPA: ABC transporter ATP-binding protein [Spirochaetota bacterium]|nr:ABC transporter ATP-binding protein [Spirochaetota bacterium]
MLKANNINKSFGGLKAINNLSFSIQKNKINSIIGPNGAGKTTVFNILTGVLKSDSGDILFESRDISKLKPHKIASIGITRTFQNLQIFSNMTVLENVITGMHLKSKSNIFQAMFGLNSKEENELKEKSVELLTLLDLKKYIESKTSILPFGILRQVEIARALGVSPKIILMDEPAAGLNPFETEELGEKIKKIIKTGVTVLLIEHDMNLVMNISDMITVLNFGEKIAEGIPQDIQKNPLVLKAYLGDET